jgi:predicted metal-dependent hydrolase
VTAAGPDDKLRAGLEAYAAGRYFEAHERWEEHWLAERDPRERRFVQALIQIAAAMHKARVTGQIGGAMRLLARALEKLRSLPPSHAGIDVGALLGAGERALAALARDGALDAALVPRLESP